MDKKQNNLPVHIVAAMAVLMGAGLLFFLFQAWQAEREASRQPAQMHVESWTSSRHVLFISSYHDTFATVVPQRQGLQEVFSENHISMDIAYMDTKNYETPENEKLFYETLRYKLANHKRYDAVVLGDDAALEFAEKHQQELFANIPMVFMCINNRTHAEEAARTPWMTGALEKYYMEDTLSLALKMWPQAGKVVAIYDNTGTGLGDYAEFQKLIPAHPELEFSAINTSTLSWNEFAAALRAIPRDALVFFLMASVDKEGNRYTLPEAASMIVSYSAAPVLRQSDGGMGLGVLGGKITDYRACGRQAARIVVDILDGAAVSSIPLMREGEGRYVFDYNVLMQFGIDPELLPEDAEVLNRNPTFWQQHKAAVLPMLGIVVTLLSLLALVYWNFRKMVQVRNQLRNTVELVTYQSTHDVMTNLPNRQAAQTEIDRRIMQNQEFTAMIVDLDNFKRLNDFYNHSIANEILVQLASRIRECFVDVNPGAYAARIGGDEFMLVLPGILREGDTGPINQVLEIFHEPMMRGEQRIPLSASIGIVSSAEEQSNSADLVFGNADIALVEAKQAGKSSYRFYRSETKKSLQRANEVEDILRDAIEREAFTVLYQPQVDAKTRKLHGYEALARLSDVKVYPDEFIPVAEDTGLIIDVGRIITKKVLHQMRHWKLEGRKLYQVAINYSCGQISDTHYPEYLAELMKACEIPASLLEVEVTESLFIGNNQQAHDLFLALAAKGVKMALDDFGTGYSSLSYLTYLPVDVVKIDKSLVDTYLHEEPDFMENLMKLLHSLNKTIVVEGVEDAQQFSELREYKADIIQGYYFSRPLPAEEAILFDPETVLKRQEKPRFDLM